MLSSINFGRIWVKKNFFIKFFYNLALLSTVSKAKKYRSSHWLFFPYGPHKSPMKDLKGGKFKIHRKKNPDSQTNPILNSVLGFAEKRGVKFRFYLQSIWKINGLRGDGERESANKQSRMIREILKCGKKFYKDCSYSIFCQILWQKRNVWHASLISIYRVFFFIKVVNLYSWKS